MTKPKPEQLTEEALTQELMTTIRQLRADEIDVKKAAELTNACGKIIKLKLGKLEYEHQRLAAEDMKVIPFFESK